MNTAKKKEKNWFEFVWNHNIIVKFDLCGRVPFPRWHGKQTSHKPSFRIKLFSVLFYLLWQNEMKKDRKMFIVIVMFLFCLFVPEY